MFYYLMVVNRLVELVIVNYSIYKVTQGFAQCMVEDVHIYKSKASLDGNLNSSNYVKSQKP